MNAWVIALAAVALASLTALVCLRHARDRRTLLLQRVRTSRTYLCVRPMLEACESLPVERVVLRPDGVTVTLFDPPGKTLSCVFEQHGLDDAAPEPLLALSQAVAEDFPILGDNQRYFFKAHQENDGDEVLRWYEYMVQPGYKNAVQRRRYDRPDG